MVSRRPFLVVLCLLTLAITSACSDVKNRSQENKPPQGAIALKVIERTTTEGNQTEKSMDKALEKTVSQNLTQALIKGVKEKKLFNDSTFSHARQDFPDNRDAKRNSADVSLHVMENARNNKPLIVASITQSVTSDENVVTQRSGKIFFNSEGIIIGFSFPDVPDTTNQEKSEVS